MTAQGKGGELRQLRDVAGISQYELAGLSGLSRNRISIFECGYVQLQDEEYGLAERTIQDVLMKKFRSAISKDETAVK